MQLFYVLVLFSLGFLLNLTKACPAQTVCTRQRDTIVQHNNTNLPGETENSSRIWYIRPRDRAFTTLLAFKNFSVKYSTVVVYVYDSSGQISTQYLYGNMGDFEIILPDCTLVIILVPKSARKLARFALNYYTGCTILSSTQDEISHYSLAYQKNQQSQCWLIHPSDSDDRKRVYFSVRDVYLPKGQQLKIWDLHTSNLIMRTNSEDYALIAAESKEIRYHQSIVVDYECIGNNCSDDYHAFFLTYYTMTQADSACIEAHKTCTDAQITTGSCTFNCPALNNMILEEFSFQSHQASIPVVRAGASYEVEKKSPHADIEKRCILPKRFCSCPAHVPKESFCASNVKCLRLGKCAFSCIYHKFATCLRITLLRSIKLL